MYGFLTALVGALAAISTALIGARSEPYAIRKMAALQRLIVTLPKDSARRANVEATLDRISQRYLAKTNSTEERRRTIFQLVGNIAVGGVLVWGAFVVASDDEMPGGLQATMGVALVFAFVLTCYLIGVYLRDFIGN